MGKTLICTSLSLAILATGCATRSFAKLEPIKQERVYQVVAEIKRQVSVYTSYQQSDYGYATVLAKAFPKICGSGRIGFDIESVKIELVSTTDNTAGANISLTPAGPIPITASGGGSTTTGNSQSLVVIADVVPSTQEVAFSREMLDDAPLAVSMINFWGATIQAGNDPSDVCLKYKESGDFNNNIYKMGITVTNAGSAKVSLGLTNVGLTASGEFKSTNGNTITVKFKPHSFKKPVKPPRENCGDNCGFIPAN
jgi:hypothetical protein